MFFCSLLHTHTHARTHAHTCLYTHTRARARSHACIDAPRTPTHMRGRRVRRYSKRKFWKQGKQLQTASEKTTTVLQLFPLQLRLSQRLVKSCLSYTAAGVLFVLGQFFSKDRLYDVCRQRVKNKLGHKMRLLSFVSRLGLTVRRYHYY